MELNFQVRVFATTPARTWTHAWRRIRLLSDSRSVQIDNQIKQVINLRRLFDIYLYSIAERLHVNIDEKMPKRMVGIVQKSRIWRLFGFLHAHEVYISFPSSLMGIFSRKLIFGLSQRALAPEMVVIFGNVYYTRIVLITVLLLSRHI